MQDGNTRRWPVNETTSINPTLAGLIGQTVPEPPTTVEGGAAVTGRAAVEPVGHVVYLVVLPGMGIANATLDREVAKREAKPLNGVTVAVPILDDYREAWPELAAETAGHLGILPAA